MDDFFSKYGWVVATGVIITIVISMMTPIGGEIQKQLIKFVKDFGGQITTLIGGIAK